MTDEKNINSGEEKMNGSSQPPIEEPKKPEDVPSQPAKSPAEKLFSPFDETEEFDEIIVDMGFEDVIDEEIVKERKKLEARYFETMKEFRSGELVYGKIVSINESDITVDIGFKSEG